MRAEVKRNAREVPCSAHVDPIFIELLTADRAALAHKPLAAELRIRVPTKATGQTAAQMQL